MLCVLIEVSTTKMFPQKGSEKHRIEANYLEQCDVSSSDTMLCYERILCCYLSSIFLSDNEDMFVVELRQQSGWSRRMNYHVWRHLEKIWISV